MNAGRNWARAVGRAIRCSLRWRPTTVLGVLQEAVGVGIALYGVMVAFELAGHWGNSSDVYILPLVFIAVRVGVGLERLARRNDGHRVGQVQR